MSARVRTQVGEERAGHPAPASVIATRAQIAKAVTAVTSTWNEVFIGMIRTLRFTPTTTPRGTLIHFHGGGFRVGCPEMTASFAAALAKRCAVEVLCPAYRLAPEYPFPAALNDGWKIIAACEARPLILSGDSAGGGLAASLAAFAVQQRTRVQAVCLLSPWLDLTMTGESYDINAVSDKLFSREAALVASELYLQGISPRDPLASPLFAALDGYPPTFISIGAGEVLADDGRRFHDALRAAGVDATLSVIDGMEHTAVARNLALPGAAATFDALAAFIDRITGGPAGSPHASRS